MNSTGNVVNTIVIMTGGHYTYRDALSNAQNIWKEIAMLYT